MEERRMDDTLEKTLLRRAAASCHPVNGTLELTPLCNMDCRMCYIRCNSEAVKQAGGLREAKEWIRLGREMREAGVLFLLLTGGEPLFFSGFQEVYLALRDMGMILTVNTNGTLLDEEWADFFGKYRPRRINITLYGADEKTYGSLCRCPGGFAKAVKAVRSLKERGVDVKLNGSVTRENRTQMQHIYGIGHNLGVPVHMDTYMLPGVRERELPFEEQARLLPEEAAGAELEAVRAELAMTADPEEGTDLFREYVKQKCALVERWIKSRRRYPDGLTCLAGSCSFAVGWQGQMRPCVTFSEPSLPVFEMGFQEAWQELRKKVGKLCINAECEVCTLRPLCKTCPAAAHLEEGACDKRPEYVCHYTKEYWRLLKETQAGMR